MKVFTSLVAFTLLVTLFSGPALGQEKKQRKNRGRSQASLFYSLVQQAVPGINGLIRLKPDQREKIEDLRKKIFGSEKVVAAQKTMRDSDANPKDRQAVVRR